MAQLPSDQENLKSLQSTIPHSLLKALMHKFFKYLMTYILLNEPNLSHL